MKEYLVVVCATFADVYVISGAYHGTILYAKTQADGTVVGRVVKLYNIYLLRMDN